MVINEKTAKRSLALYAGQLGRLVQDDTNANWSHQDEHVKWLRSVRNNFERVVNSLINQIQSKGETS